MSYDELQYLLSSLEECEHKENMIECEKLADRIVGQFSDNPRALAYASHVFTWCGRSEDSSKWGEKALQMAPDDPYVLAERADSASFNADTDLAEKYANQALEIESEDSWILLRCTSVFTACGRNEDGLKYSKQIVDQNPDADWAWSNYLTHLSSNANNNIDSVIDDAMQRFPNSPSILQKHSRRLIKQTKMNEAIEVLERAIELAPYSSSLWRDLGMLYATTGKLDEAEKCSLKALDLRMINPAAYMTLARIARMRGDDKAKEEYRDKAESVCPILGKQNSTREILELIHKGKWHDVLIKVDEKLPKMSLLSTRRLLLGWKAQALVELENFDEADAILSGLEQSIPSTVELRARILKSRGLLADAVVLLQQSIESNPKNGAIRARLIRFLFEQGQQEQMYSVVEDTYNNLPDTPIGFSSLVMAVSDVNLKEETLSLLDLGLDMYPGNEQLLLLKAVSNLTIGDTKTAKQIAPNLKGDMRDAAPILNKAATAMDKLQAKFAEIIKKKESKNPPKLN